MCQKSGIPQNSTIIYFGANGNNHVISQKQQLWFCPTESQY